MHDYTHVLLTSFYSAVIVLGQAFGANFSGIVGWTIAKALIMLGFLKIPLTNRSLRLSTQTFQAKNVCIHSPGTLWSGELFLRPCP